MQPDTAQDQTTNLSTKLSQLSEAKSECSIYKVHDLLRNGNPKAYEPNVIAIGPYHRGKTNLMMKEEHKLRHLQLILQRKNEHVQKFESAILPLEQEARQCYAEPISLNASQFVQMLVLDGCFIIELLRKFHMQDLGEENDPIFQMPWILFGLQRDLMLFENQIPFFVLCKLFDLIEDPNRHTSLIDLVLKFFHAMIPVEQSTGSIDERLPEIKHILDLIHRKLYPSSGLPRSDKLVAAEDTGNGFQFIESATRLREANVKFKSYKGSMLDVKFENGIMSLPRLVVDDGTETFLRNMIAYEQYFEDKKSSSLTNYVILLDKLIDSSRDVEILCRDKIIDNWLGDNEVVANMLNKLTDSIVADLEENFLYRKIFEDVNVHCKKRRNRWRARLRHEHLNSPWTVIPIVAGTVLLLLTLVQAVCSVLQLKK